MRRPIDEVRTGIEADDRDEPGESERLEHPQRRRRDAAEESRPHRSQPAAHEAAEQHADAQAQPDLDAAQHQRGNADERAGDDAERDEHHVGDVGRAVGDADARRRLQRRDRAGPDQGQRRRRAGAPSPGNIGIGRPGARDPPQEDAAREFLAGEVGERAAVDVGGRHDDVQRFGGNVEQLRVVDLQDAEPLLVHPARRAARAVRRPPCGRAAAERSSPSGSMIAIVRGACARRTGARRRASCFELPHAAVRRAASPAARRTRGTRFPPAGDVGIAPALHLLFVAPALLLEVDAHEPRRELRQEPGRADDADQVGDGEGDRNAVDHRAGVGVGQPEPRDRIARRADRRRLGERAGDDAGGRAGVVAEQPADHVGDDQPGGRDDRPTAPPAAARRS